MGTVTTWASPAKINLFLHINGRRADGYHELQTVFAILADGDELSIETTNVDEVVVLPDLGFPMEENIVYRAAMLLKEHTGCKLGAHITINKHIPMGGGLGGGSSNAATAMCALNAIWHLNLEPIVLEKLGRTLGADVPVFIRGESTFADGVGEIFTSYPVKEQWCLVVTPKNTNVSTKAIFTNPDLPRHTPKLDPKTFVMAETKNDCEDLVKKIYPNVAITLEWLLKYAHPRMTGTGASCFALFAHETEARKAWSEMPANLQGFVTKICQKSPLKAQLDAFTKGECH